MRIPAAVTALVVFLTLSPNAHAFLGTELAPLLQIVSGQLTEIERLTETVGIAKDQARMLRELNDGIDRTVSQIQNLQSIIERAQGLDPRQVKSISDLNDLLYRAKQTKAQIDEMTDARLALADQAILQSALQSDTAYRMGQEMVASGATLANESQTASPGRATQISAASGSAQMLADGVQLQTMAQIVQLQALSLEFQKAQVEREVRDDRLRRVLYARQLAQGSESSRRGNLR